jgi:Dipeptidyl aminopeptidases/acylaminoacyl-peptidases
MRLTLLAALLLAPCASSAAHEPPMASPPPMRQLGALTFDGIPEFENLQGSEEMRRFDAMRTAFFQGWLADGSMLIQTRFGRVDQIHRVRAPGMARTQLTFGDEPVGGALPRPGSEQFLFARDRGGDEAYQAYLGPSDTDAVQVTEPGTRNEHFVFSPGGRWLAWSRLTPGQPDAHVMVMEVDVQGSRHAAYLGTGTVAPVDISRDGRLILIEQRQSIARNQYLLLDRRSGQTRRLLPERAEAAFRNGRFLDDGVRIALTLVGDSGVRSLAILDTRTGKLFYPAGESPWDVELFDVAPDGHRIAFSLNVDGFSQVAILDLRDTQGAHRIPVPQGMVFKLSFTGDGSRLGIGLSTAAGGDVWSWDAAQGLTRWTYSELGGLAEEELARPEIIRFPSFDGREIPALIYRPVKAPRDPRPVIVSIHGGPEAQERSWFNAQYQLWTRMLGAVVVAPNVRGSTGYGRDYLALDDGLNRLDAVKDIGALLDWIEAQPDLDASRVVVYGESYGGFMSLASLAHYSDRLAGAIDVVGISNFTTFLQNTEGYRRDRRRAEYGDERDPEIRDFFDRISPVFHADKMRKPLLVVAGANDVRVPVSESRAIVDKVRSTGGEAWLLIAGDEGHGFQKRENQEAQARVQLQFLTRLFSKESMGGRP